MTSILRTSAALCVLLILVGPAAALSVTNTDDTPHKIVLTLGDQKSEHVVEAGATLELDCDEGCSLSVEGAEADQGEFQAEGEESLEISNGELENPDAAPDADVKDAEADKKI